MASNPQDERHNMAVYSYPAVGRQDDDVGGIAGGVSERGPRGTGTDGLDRAQRAVRSGRRRMRKLQSYWDEDYHGDSSSRDEMVFVFFVMSVALV